MTRKRSPESGRGCSLSATIPSWSVIRLVTPRIAFYNAYPMEFVQTKDRLIEFFDFFYVHRTIYMDGRKLPDDPDPTWYGYSVGHWDGKHISDRDQRFQRRILAR